MDLALLTAMTLAPRQSAWRVAVHSREASMPFRAPLKNAGAAAALLVLSAALVSLGVHAQTDAPGEYQLKAAFLFNFAKFVQWPATAFTSPQSDFNICLIGDDPFGKSIDDVLRDKSVGEHPVAILRLKGTSEVPHCQILFVSSSEKKRFSEILTSVKGSNVLLVGETDGFAESGGAIQFVIVDQRVRFIINLDAAERAGLQVSSKLLALARIVHEAPLNRKS